MHSSTFESVQLFFAYKFQLLMCMFSCGYFFILAIQHTLIMKLLCLFQYVTDRSIQTEAKNGQNNEHFVGYIYL